MDSLLKTPPEGERNALLKLAYKYIPDTVPPVAIYGVLGVVGFIVLKGALK